MKSHVEAVQKFYKFKQIFQNDKFKYKGVKLYLVSDYCNPEGKYESHQQYIEKLKKCNSRDSLRFNHMSIFSQINVMESQ